MQFFYIGKTDSKTRERIETMLTKRGHSLAYFDLHQSSFFHAYTQQRDYILASDGVIGSADEVDTLTGYYLSQALESGKPCLLVQYTKDTPCVDIADLEHKKLTKAIYEDRLGLEDFVDEFLQSVTDALDAKLFMIIPPEVNKYLDWVANNTAKSKSDVVRASVIETANKDKDYQEFLNRYQLAVSE